MGACPSRVLDRRAPGHRDGSRGHRPAAGPVCGLCQLEWYPGRRSGWRARPHNCPETSWGSTRSLLYAGTEPQSGYGSESGGHTQWKRAQGKCRGLDFPTTIQGPLSSFQAAGQRQRVILTAQQNLTGQAEVQQLHLDSIKEEHQECCLRPQPEKSYPKDPSRSHPPNSALPESGVGMEVAATDASVQEPEANTGKRGGQNIPGSGSLPLAPYPRPHSEGQGFRPHACFFPSHPALAITTGGVSYRECRPGNQRPRTAVNWLYGSGPEIMLTIVTFIDGLQLSISMPYFYKLCLVSSSQHPCDENTIIILIS